MRSSDRRDLGIVQLVRHSARTALLTLSWSYTCDVQTCSYVQHSDDNLSEEVTASELIISQTTSRRALQPVKAAVYKLRPTSEIEKTTLCTVHAIEDVRGNNSGCCDQSSRRLSVSCVRYYSHSTRIDDGSMKRSVDIHISCANITGHFSDILNPVTRQAQNQMITKQLLPHSKPDITSVIDRIKHTETQ